MEQNLEKLFEEFVELENDTRNDISGVILNKEGIEFKLAQENIVVIQENLDSFIIRIDGEDHDVIRVDLEEAFLAGNVASKIYHSIC